MKRAVWLCMAAILVFSVPVYGTPNETETFGALTGVWSDRLTDGLLSPSGDTTSENEVTVFSNTIPNRGVTVYNHNDRLVHLSSYFAGIGNIWTEIVAFNPHNDKMYVVVGGDTQVLDIVDIKDPVNPVRTHRVDIREMANEKGFSHDDFTSIAVHPDGNLVALAIQNKDFTQSGSIVLVNADGVYQRHFAAGVQPDMITFTPCGTYVLTADEGEPRDGIGAGLTDPPGSVTVVRLSDNYVRIVGFDDWNSRRDELIANGVIIEADTLPSLDFEPEYIAVSADSKSAFVALQENNAIATLCLDTFQFTDIRGLGFVDHSQPGNEIDIDRSDGINIRSRNVFGVRMPDGIATATIGGEQYIVTANEGDAREWGSYVDVFTAGFGGATNVEFLRTNMRDGLRDDRTYMLGSRGFSIFRASDMSVVFDSGNQFEAITAQLIPTRFNANHSGSGVNVLDARSHRKGPEPESAAILQYAGRTYAFITLERIGGIFMYDMTSPANAFYVDYINVRNFDMAWDATNPHMHGDLGAEGITTVTVENSPIGMPLVLAANEASGTVSIFGVNPVGTPPAPPPPPTTSGFYGEGWIFQNEGARAGTLTIYTNTGTTTWRTENGNNFKYDDVTELVILNDVTSIGVNAFSGTSIKSVSIPGSVTTIGDDAFANNTALTSVTFNTVTPPDFGTNVFSAGNPTIYVPTNAYAAYRAVPALSGLNIVQQFVVPPTGLPSITGAMLIMFALMTTSAALWVLVLRGKLRKPHA